MKIKLRKIKPYKAAVCELSSLDDWTLLPLLDQVPLTDLLRLGQVNRRFNHLVKRNCLHSVRRHIVLVIGSRRVVSSSDQFNCITIDQLNNIAIAIKGIHQLLPYTTSLKIVYKARRLDVFDWVIYLLKSWIDQLVVLDLVFSIKGPLLDQRFIKTTHLKHIMPLFDLLNRMHQLKELRIKNLSKIVNWMEFPLPIISQLQVFTFIDRDGASWMLRQLRTHATNTLREVNLRQSLFFDMESIHQLIEMPPHLASTFKTLYLGNHDIHFPQLDAICQNYQSLQSLRIQLVHFTVGLLSRALVMLPALTKLTIGADFKTYWFLRVGESPDLVPLPTVTSLKLELYLKHHSDLDRLHLGVLFPNLVTLNFSPLGCNEEKCLESDSNIVPQVPKGCLKQLQANGTFGELLPKLCTVLCNGKPLPKKYWQPSPPKTLIGSVSSFFCRIPKRLRKLAGKFKKVPRVLNCWASGAWSNHG